MQVKKLTDEQEYALGCTGNCVIVAGPGSGKTTVLSQKIARVLTQLPPYKGIAAISYTNKASNELRDRVAVLAKDTKASFFGTIDKFYIREVVLPFAPYLLDVSRVEDPTFVSESTPQWDAIIDQLHAAVLELDRRQALPGAPLPASAHQALAALGPLFSQGLVHLRTVGPLAFLTVMQSHACRRFLKARYAQLFIDEYQDSDFGQHALFMLLSRIGFITTMVGDLNQSIFGFADKDAKYLQALTTDPRFSVAELLDNHRCHSSIRDYANRFLGKKGSSPGEDRRVFWQRIIGDETTASRWIESILEDAKSTYDITDNSQVAILGRSGNTLSRVANALRVPFQYHMTLPIEEHNAPCANFCTEVLRVWLGDKTRIPDLAEQLFRLETPLGKWQAERFSRSVREAGGRFHAGDRVAAKTFLAQMCDKQRISGWDEEFEAILDETLRHKHLTQAFAPVCPEQVQLYTLHKSKGLEFDVVIHMDLHDYILPSFEALDWKLSDRARRWTLTQDANLHYVGLTRARKAVFLVSNTIRHNKQNEEKKGVRSQFLSDALRPYAEILPDFTV